MQTRPSPPPPAPNAASYPVRRDPANQVRRVARRATTVVLGARSKSPTRIGGAAPPKDSPRVWHSDDQKVPLFASQFRHLDLMHRSIVTRTPYFLQLSNLETIRWRDPTIRLWRAPHNARGSSRNPARWLCHEQSATSQRKRATMLFCRHHSGPEAKLFRRSQLQNSHPQAPDNCHRQQLHQQN